MAKICVICLFFYLIIHCKALVRVAGNYESGSCTLRERSKESLCISEYRCKFYDNESDSSQALQHCVNTYFPMVWYGMVCYPLEGSGIKCLTYHKNPNPSEEFVAHGVPTQVGEFPHMAAIGYGDINNTQWLCGGSLISETFVLTAAHCIHPKNLGPAKWIRLGDTDLQDKEHVPEPQNFIVSQYFIHPDHKPPSRYHDIALIKLDRPAVLNAFVRPACLHVEKSVPGILSVTGWGKTDIYGRRSNHLLKAEVNPVIQDICKEHYASISKKKLPKGIRDDIHLCAGHPEGRDTCPGDSGGPLQYKKSASPDYFIIVGVTSFGRACGLENSTGVYTRVSSYTQWIENIILPQ